MKDSASFWAHWARSPRQTGAIAASSPALSRAMAAPIDPKIPGTVVEFGPGTGPVTAAIIERGITPDRLVMIEMNASFRNRLQSNYPDARILEVDAFAIDRVAQEQEFGQLSAIVSSLPLLNWPIEERVKLLHKAFALLRPGCPFIQFTYGPTSPIPMHGGTYHVHKSRRIWANIPPATVWTYRAR